MIYFILKKFKKKIFEITLILILLRSFFLSRLERKYVGFPCARIARFSRIYFGFLHAFSDFVKLLRKTFLEINFISSFLWSIILLKSFCLVYILFFSIFYRISFFINLNILIFIFLYTIVIYLFICLNWSSSRIFSFLTLHRLIIQIISYESCIIFNFITLIIIRKSINLISYKSIIIISYFFLLILIISFIRELRRQPYDFIECESELVSGFNIEYSGRLIRLIFLLEYFLQILILVILIRVTISSFIFITFFFLHLRTFLPRTRLDLILNFFWKEIIILIRLYIFFRAII